MTLLLVPLAVLLTLGRLFVIGSALVLAVLAAVSLVAGYRPLLKWSALIIVVSVVSFLSRSS